MNLTTLCITGYVRGNDDWIVEVSYQDFKGRNKVRAIGVPRHILTADDAVRVALESLKKSVARKGFILPPQIFSCTPKRRVDWMGKYPKDRVVLRK